MNQSEIELLIKREVEGAGRLASYKNVWHALRLRHLEHVPRFFALVARLMKKIDSAVSSYSLRPSSVFFRP